MLKTCKICSGSGYVTVQGRECSVVCDFCQGKGGFDVPDNKKLCPTCKGKGKITVHTDMTRYHVSYNCTTCFTTGFIDKA